MTDTAFLMRQHGDFTDRYGAGLLADFLTEHWHAKGHTQVSFKRFQVSETTAYGIESNLINGLPPTAMKQARRMVVQHPDGTVSYLSDAAAIDGPVRMERDGDRFAPSH